MRQDTFSQEAGQEGEYRVAADEMRLISQQVAANARESVQGEEATFSDLAKNLENFEWQLGQLQAVGFHDEVVKIEERWQVVVSSAQVLIDASERIVFLH